MGIFGRVCFLTFSDLRHFWCSKGGVQNRDGEEEGEEEEGGKCSLNCQIDLILDIYSPSTPSCYFVKIIFI